MGDNQSRSRKEFRHGADQDASPAPNNAPAKKKTYHKPDFHFERVFETMALSCGKLPGHFRCGLNKKLS